MNLDMIVIHLFDEPSLYAMRDQINNVLIMVDHYEAGCYDGMGWGLVLNKDGSIEEYNLGHCSCYGPYEDSHKMWKSKKEFLDDCSSVIGVSSPQEVIDAFIAELNGIT